jgi:serine protease Do
MNQKQKLLFLSSAVLISAIALSACSPSSLPIGALTGITRPAAPQQAAEKPAAPQQEAAPLSPAPSNPQSSNLGMGQEEVLTTVYEKVNPSVVSIQVVIGEGDQITGGQGSGFVWDQDGHIVTNNHVVEGDGRIQVILYDGTSYPAKLVGTDPDADLAVIKIDAPREVLKPIEVGDSSQQRVGETAIAIGNPFGLANTMTVGIISAIGRSLPASSPLNGAPGFSNPDVIQTDAAINPGNSGGALVDENGQLIGVPYQIESPVRANSGVGFAIPSNTVKRVIPVLIDNGTYTYSWLGISGSGLVPQIAEAMKLDSGQRGVLVGEVTAGGPADNAGLLGSQQSTTIDGIEIKVGGDVITAIEGQTVKGMDDLISYLSSNTRPEQVITLTILRNGKTSDIKVTLGTRPASVAQAPQNPSNPQGPQEPQAAPSAYLGISSLPLSDEIKSDMGLPADTQGILIVKTEPGSPADQAGLQQGTRPTLINGQMVLLGGDVVTSINGQPITSVQELRGILSQLNSGDQVTLEVLRDGKTLTVEVTLADRPQQ